MPIIVFCRAIFAKATLFAAYAGLLTPATLFSRGLLTTLAADSYDMHSKLHCITFVIQNYNEMLHL